MHLVKLILGFGLIVQNFALRVSMFIPKFHVKMALSMASPLRGNFPTHNTVQILLQWPELGNKNKTKNNFYATFSRFHNNKYLACQCHLLTCKKLDK